MTNYNNPLYNNPQGGVASYGNAPTFLSNQLGALSSPNYSTPMGSGLNLGIGTGETISVTPNFNQTSGGYGFANPNTGNELITPSGGIGTPNNGQLNFGNWVRGIDNNGYPVAPQPYGSTGLMGGLKGAFNGLGGLQGITSLIGSGIGLYGALQGLSLAKKDFKFRKSMAEANQRDSRKSYDTSLSNIARTRAVMTGQSDADRDRYIKENSLS